MYTICETSLFSKFYSDYWTEKEYNEFKIFLASNPEVGDVEPNSGGIRKVRWGSGKTGKSGGVRVIYYNRLANGQYGYSPFMENLLLINSIKKYYVL